MRLRVAFLPALIFLVLIPALNIVKIIRSPFREFRAPAQGFSIEFPWPWVPTVTSKITDIGAPLSTYQVDVGKQTSFAVAVIQFPPAAVPHVDAAFYTRTVEMFAGMSGGKIRTTYPYPLAGHAGMAAVIDNEQRFLFDQLRISFVLLVNVVQVKSRLYAVMSVGTFGHETNPAAWHFRDSFRLIGEDRKEAGAINRAPPRMRFARLLSSPF